VPCSLNIETEVFFGFTFTHFLGELFDDLVAVVNHEELAARGIRGAEDAVVPAVRKQCLRVHVGDGVPDIF
jgi:hypothetical protein